MLTTIISVIAALSGILLGWLGQARIAKQQQKEQTKTEVSLELDIKHIMDVVGRLEASTTKDISRLNGRVDQLFNEADATKEKVIVASEAVKSAHRRLDYIENKQYR